MQLINAYQCMLLIWIHDAYCTYYQLLMYATYVIDQRVVLRVVLSINDAFCDWYRVLYHYTRYVCYHACSRSTMHSIDLSWHHSIIDMLQLLSLSTSVRMSILSIDTVWHICYPSRIHVIDWWCILRMLSINRPARRNINKCSTNAIMRYSNTWGPTMSFSIDTLWQPERVT